MRWERCRIEKKTSFHSCFVAHSMVYDHKANPHLIRRTCAVLSPTLVNKYFLRYSMISLHINPSLRFFRHKPLHTAPYNLRL